MTDEICQECGKRITRRAKANVFEERIVCTPCWQKLDNLRQPATEAQIQYARDLGILFHANITKVELSKLISAVVDQAERKEQEEADAFTEQATYRWVYSVCRHMLDANWLRHVDSQLPRSKIDEVVKALYRDPVFEQVQEQEDGWSDKFNDDKFAIEVAVGDVEVDFDEWYFFGNDGPSTRTNAYRRTRELIEQHLGQLLPTVQTRIPYIKLAKQQAPRS